MDINETLKLALENAARILGCNPEDYDNTQFAEWAVDLAQQVSDINYWLSKGGFKPEVWREK